MIELSPTDPDPRRGGLPSVLVMKNPVMTKHEGQVCRAGRMVSNDLVEVRNRCLSTAPNVVGFASPGLPLIEIVVDSLGRAGPMKVWSA